MTEASMRGAIGSVALLLRVLQGRIFVDVLDTLYLTPKWNPQEPDTLATVDERYEVSGADLIKNGYEIDEPDAQYWFARRWERTRKPGLNLIVSEPQRLPSLILPGPCSIDLGRFRSSG